MKNYINCTKFVNIAGRKMAYNVRVLGEEADKQDHIPDASKKVNK